MDALVLGTVHVLPWCYNSDVRVMDVFKIHSF